MAAAAADPLRHRYQFLVASDDSVDRSQAEDTLKAIEVGHVSSGEMIPTQNLKNTGLALTETKLGRDLRNFMLANTHALCAAYRAPGHVDPTEIIKLMRPTKYVELTVEFSRHEPSHVTTKTIKLHVLATTLDDVEALTRWAGGECTGNIVGDDRFERWYDPATNREKEFPPGAHVRHMTVQYED